MNDVTEKDQEPNPGGALEQVGFNPPARPGEQPARPAPPPRPAPPERPDITFSAPPSIQAQMPRPRAIAVSWWLWVAAGLAAMCTGALAILDWDDLKADMLVKVTEEFPDEDADTLVDLAEAAIACLIGIGLLLAISCVLFAAYMYNRRNWGRICVTVFAVITILYALVNLSWSPGDIQAGLVITALLMVAALVTMYLPGNKEWYTLSKLYRTDENTKVF